MQRTTTNEFIFLETREDDMYVISQIILYSKNVFEVGLMFDIV